MMIKSFSIKKYKSLIWIVLSAILIVIFYNKSIVNKEKYYVTINSLNKLKEINSRLYGNLFLTQFNKIKHYDVLRENIKLLSEDSLSFKEFSNDVNVSSFKYNLNKYLKELEIKEEYLNNLISHFAIYKNFIEFYPKLSSDMAFKFSDKDRELSLLILNLQNAILLFNYNDKLDVFDILEDIQNKRVFLNKEEKIEIDYLMKFTNNIIKNKKSIEDLENRFLSIDLSENINLLISNFDFHYAKLEKNSDIYNILMMLVVLSLFFWIIYFVINLNKANNKVNDAMRELNFQKSALDEHAIVSITDEKGKITYVNEKFCVISGYSKEELLGKNHRVLKSDEHDDEFFKTLWFVIKNGKTWRGEVKNRKKDGSFYWVSATVVPFLNEEGNPFKYISIRTDITKRKKIEEDLINAKEKADESNKVKSEFLANMSHELRTPLNGVIGMANIALENEKDKKQRLYLEKIDLSANILLKIINDLLDYSKIEAGKLPIENIEFNVDTLLQSVADLVSVKAYEKDLELLFNRDMRIPKVLIGDSLRISQVLVNIIGNSIKFTENGDVSLEVRFENCENHRIFLQFIVKDTGIGMDEKTLNNIFNSFTQADASTSRKYGGTGLGLTITKNLVELMGGKISVESEVNIGSTFIVTLPFEFIEDNQEFDYDLTKDVLVDLYSLSNPIKDSLKTILNSLKIDYIESDNINVFQEGKKVIIISENDTVLKSEKLAIYLTNPNKNLKAENDNIKVISKPINPSVIYDSILEFLDISTENFSKVSSKNRNKYKDVNVLLVEDNEINQLVASTFLENLSCNITIANNGLESVNLIKDKNNSFDIVFMDIQMPIMNGYEATNVLRDDLKLDIPIIAMTANAMKEDIEKAKSVGMNSHISKPIDPKEIESAILAFVLGKKRT